MNKSICRRDNATAIDECHYEVRDLFSNALTELMLWYSLCNCHCIYVDINLPKIREYSSMILHKSLQSHCCFYQVHLPLLNFCFEHVLHSRMFRDNSEIMQVWWLWIIYLLMHITKSHKDITKLCVYIFNIIIKTLQTDNYTMANLNLHEETLLRNQKQWNITMGIL